jgi:trimeric autotransporter adhesin
MKRYIFFLGLMGAYATTNAQMYWQASAVQVTKNSTAQTKNTANTFKLDLKGLEKALQTAPTRESGQQGVEIMFPNSSGEFEAYEVYLSHVMDPALAKQYGLASYVGYPKSKNGNYLRFSLSPEGLQATINSNGKVDFIELKDQNKTQTYRVGHKQNTDGKIKCEQHSSADQVINELKSKPRHSSARIDHSMANNKEFRTLKIAISVSGEYYQFFGDLPKTLAGINATITTVNAIYERELATTLQVINTPGLIYTNPATDPYTQTALIGGDQTNPLHDEIQANFNTYFTNNPANYDLGHTFFAIKSAGNAGDVGCACNPQKKSKAFTSHKKPQGAAFDVDFVAHEIGHQLGATHVFSYEIEKGSTTQVEPGSGSTIMAYAGITNADVQKQTDDYFNAISIVQIKNYLANQNCGSVVNVPNQLPNVVMAAPYTIPHSTPFFLEANANDPDGNALTYNWEQSDIATSPVTEVYLEMDQGPHFRSWPPSTSAKRYFPKYQTVLDGKLWDAKNWEALSNHETQFNFKLSVRDNAVNKPLVRIEDQVVNVSSDGPFQINNLNRLSKIWLGKAFDLTWDVANTTASQYASPNVRISISNDNGATWDILQYSTPNDGQQPLVIPNSYVNGNIRFKIEAIGNIFYCLSPSVAVLPDEPCQQKLPQNIYIEELSNQSAYILWEVGSRSIYSFRYRKVGDTNWTEVATRGNSVRLSQLLENQKYEFQVASICDGKVSEYTAAQSFSTKLGKVLICNIQSMDSSEHSISNVTVNGMSQDSGPSPYADYTKNLNKHIRLAVGSSGHKISVSSKSRDSSLLTIMAWIDFNSDGNFDSSEIILNSKKQDATTVSANFSVPSNAKNIADYSTLRVMLSDNNGEELDTCANLNNGEIEDYAVVFYAEKAKLDIAPRLAKDTLNIINNQAEQVIYKIYDMEGRLLKNRLSNKELIINIEDLQAGKYVVELIDGDNRSKTNFIKQ